MKPNHTHGCSTPIAIGEQIAKPHEMMSVAQKETDSNALHTELEQQSVEQSRYRLAPYNVNSDMRRTES